MTKEYAKVLLSDQLSKLKDEIHELNSKLETVTSAVKACDYFKNEFNKDNGKDREEQLLSFLFELIKAKGLDGCSEFTKLSKKKLRRY